MNKGPQQNSRRNRLILEFYKQHGELTFEAIARKFRVTRHVIAGVIGRHKRNGLSKA